MEEFVTLSGDILFERKKLSESLKRLESIISSPDLTSQLGAQSLIELQSEMDHLSHGMYRLGALARMLGQRAQDDGSSSSESFFKDALTRLQETSKRLGRVVSVKSYGLQNLIDKTKVHLFKNVFFEMLDIFVEFSTETPRERVLRGKKETVNFRVTAKKNDDGVQVTVIADGNGLIPPLVDKHGEVLARIGIRANFEGKPGRWSCWTFHIPHSSLVSNCIKVHFGKNCIYIPANFVLNVMQAKDFNLVDHEQKSIFELNSELERVPVSSGTPLDLDQKIIEVAAGVHRVWLVIDSVDEREEVFMKPLLGPFTGNGRFIGVVVETEQGEQMLNIVMNPSYLVYGIQATQGEIRAV